MNEAMRPDDRSARSVRDHRTRGGARRREAGRGATRGSAVGAAAVTLALELAAGFAGRPPSGPSDPVGPHDPRGPAPTVDAIAWRTDPLHAGLEVVRGRAAAGVRGPTLEPAAATGDGPTALAITPDGTIVAVGFRTAADDFELVELLGVEPSGRLRRLGAFEVPDRPRAIMWLDDRSLVVAWGPVGGPGGLDLWSVDPSSGVAQRRDSVVAGPLPAALRRHPTRPVVYLSDGLDGTLRWWTVRDGARLIPGAERRPAGGPPSAGDPDPSRWPTGISGPTALAIEPAGDRLWFGGGRPDGGQIGRIDLNPASGAPRLPSAATWSVDSGRVGWMSVVGQSGPDGRSDGSGPPWLVVASAGDGSVATFDPADETEPRTSIDRVRIAAAGRIGGMTVRGNHVLVSAGAASRSGRWNPPAGVHLVAVGAAGRLRVVAVARSPVRDGGSVAGEIVARPVIRGR